MTYQYKRSYGDDTVKYYLAYDGSNVIFCTSIPTKAVLLRTDAFDSVDEIVEYLTWQYIQVKEHKIKLPVHLQESMKRFLFGYQPVKVAKMQMCRCIFD